MRILEGYQKGINLGGWLSQCVSYEKAHFDTFIVEDDIRTIAEWGCDHIRLPIDYDIIETEDGKDKEEGYQHIDDCLAWCRKYGLHMMLDLHKSFGYMFDTKAVPDPDKFFTDENLQNRFYKLWEQLTARYAKYEDFLVFELLNEVVNPDYADVWNQIAAKAIDIIRKTAPTIGIVVGGVWHNSVSAIPMLTPPVDENIIYTFHCYEPLCFTHQKAHWVENIDYELSYPADVALYKEKSLQLNQNHAGAIFGVEVKEVGPEYFRYMFAPAVEYAQRHNAALYCGEYGVIDQAPAPDTLRWLADINEVFAELGIGRALWNYRQKDFGIMDEHYHDIRDQMIALITK